MTAGIKLEVLKHQRDVVLADATGQAQRLGVAIVFVARIDFIEYQIEAGQALVNIGRGGIEAVVVVPQRAQGLA